MSDYATVLEGIDWTFLVARRYISDRREHGLPLPCSFIAYMEDCRCGFCLAYALSERERDS